MESGLGTPRSMDSMPSVPMKAVVNLLGVRTFWGACWLAVLGLCALLASVEALASSVGADQDGTISGARDSVGAVAKGRRWVLSDPELPAPNWASVRLIREARLATATAVAYGADEQWRVLADAAADRGVVLTWESLPERVAAQYVVEENRIVVNRIHRDASLAALAALIAHETYHAVSDQCRPPLNAEACLAGEVDAYGWQAHVYGRVADQLKGDSPLDTQMAFVARLVQQNRLREVVLQEQYYQNIYLSNRRSGAGATLAQDPVYAHRKP